MRLEFDTKSSTFVFKCDKLFFDKKSLERIRINFCTLLILQKSAKLGNI